jgi:hypothetical protein
MFKQSYPIPAPTYFSASSAQPFNLVLNLATGPNPIPVAATQARMLIIKAKFIFLCPTPANSGADGWDDLVFTVISGSTLSVSTHNTGGGGGFSNAIAAASINANGDLQISLGSAGGVTPYDIWFEVDEMTLYGDT